MADRTLVVKILGDDRSLHSAFSRSSKDAGRWGDTIQRATRGGVVATVGFRGLGRSVAFASGAFLGGAGFVAAAKGAVTAASNLSEQINKTNVLFEKSSGGVQRFAKTTAASLGLSQRAALEAAGGFGAMLETAGLTSAEAAKFSKNLVRLGADMASFNNIDPSEALLKLKSGLAGEAEPLRTVGVLLSETRVKQEAYRLGLAKVGETLTEGQKVQARYALILKDTAKQQGDFGRTSGGLANQQRILAAQVENLQAAIGEALLPDLLKVVKALNTWLSSSENQARVQREINSAIKTAESVFSGFLEVARPLAKVAQQTADALGGVKNTVKLLIAAFVASKIIAFTSSLTGLSAQALVATGRVSALRFALLRLGVIGAITIGIELILNRKEIQDQFLKEIQDQFLNAIGIDTSGGPFKGLPIKVKADNLVQITGTLTKLKAIRAELLEKSQGFMTVPIARVNELISKLEKAARTMGGIDVASERKGRGGVRPGPGPVSAVDAINDVIGETNAALARLQKVAKASKVKAIAAFQGLMDSLSRAGTLAGASAGLADDLRVLRAQLAAVQAEIKVEGRTKDLLDQQADLTAQITTTQRDIAANAQQATVATKAASKAREQAARANADAARKANQFLKLGLTREGQERVPGVAALSKRLTSIREQVKGTVLDTPKTQAELARIAKVLAGKFGKAGRDVRSAILQMFNDIAGALDQGGKKAGGLSGFKKVNTKKFFEGLGLSPEELKAARARLSQLGPGGTVPGKGVGAFGFAVPGTAPAVGRGDFIFTGAVTINATDAADVERWLQKKARRTRASRRGSMAGKNRGLG